MKLVLKYSEAELIGMLKKHDNEAYTYLYDNYSETLFGTILNFIPDRNMAADVLQDVFVNIYRKIDTFDDSRIHLYSWMTSVAKNLAIDTLRSKAYRNNKSNHDIARSHDAKTISITLHVDNIGLYKLLERIKPKYRELIILNYLKGYTHEEIAVMLNVPLGTIKTRIRAALIQLKALMK